MKPPDGDPISVVDVDDVELDDDVELVEGAELVVAPVVVVTLGLHTDSFCLHAACTDFAQPFLQWA
jgi:hypothetical protein